MATATKPAAPTSGGSRRGPAKTTAGGGGTGRHRGSQSVEGRAKKAAEKEAGAGGPENPVADVKAAKALAGGGKKSGGAAKAKALATKSPVLLAEFVVCFVILGLGTLASPKGSANAGVPRLMLKSSALAGIFLILALASSVGGKAQKTAGALGGLVTVTYIVASPDAIALFTWATTYFTGSKASAAAPAGATQTSGQSGSTAGMTGASQ